jgi:hypothetical protein
VKPNTEKGRSYAWAFQRLKEAHQQGYYIEAAAVAESIIADRLYSILLAKGETFKPGKDGHPTFGALILALEKHLDGSESFNLERLRAFQKARNTAIHQVAKSQPGEPTLKVEDFLKTAELASSEGGKLARGVVDWHRAQLPPALKNTNRRARKTD